MYGLLLLRQIVWIAIAASNCMDCYCCVKLYGLLLLRKIVWIAIAASKCMDCYCCVKMYGLLLLRQIVWIAIAASKCMDCYCCVKMYGLLLLRQVVWIAIAASKFPRFKPQISHLNVRYIIWHIIYTVDTTSLNYTKVSTYTPYHSTSVRYICFINVSRRVTWTGLLRISLEVKNAWSFTSDPSKSFVVWCLEKEDKRPLCLCSVPEVFRWGRSACRTLHTASWGEDAWLVLWSSMKIVATTDCWPSHSYLSVRVEQHDIHEILYGHLSAFVH